MKPIVCAGAIKPDSALCPAMPPIPPLPHPRMTFTVINNAEGVAFLLEAVRTTIKRYAIKPAQVIYGGEDEPAYVSNFLAALAAKKALVVRVNAAEAKKQREGFTASTDDLDLLGIAKSILTRRVTAASPARLSDEESRRVLSLRELVRGRRRMVFSLTAVKNQIHALTDRLFPEFLDEKKSGVIAFSEASLLLMEAAFSAPALARRKPAALATLLCRGGCGEARAREKAAQLQECARAALAPEPSQVAALQESLGSSVRLLRSTMDVIENLTAAMAEELSRLPAAFFTTLPGVGVVLACRFRRNSQAAPRAQSGHHDQADLPERSRYERRAIHGIHAQGRRCAQAGGRDGAESHRHPPHSSASRPVPEPSR